MKKLFEGFLYLNVAVGSLFFVVWLWTTFPAFLSVPAEGSPAIDSPLPSSENASSLHPPSSPPPPIKEANPVPNSPSGSASPPPTNDGSRTGNNLAIPSNKGADVSNPAPPSDTLKNNLAISRKGASVTNTAPPSGTSKKNNSIPLPPNPSSSAGLENSQLPPSPQGEDNSIPHPPDPSSAELEDNQLPSSSLQGKEKILEESETSSNKAIKSGTAKDLQGITQKVADIYEMLSNYQYDSEDRRDPFAPFQVEEQPTTVEGVVEEDTPPTYPTGKYSIEEIKLVGIKWNSKIGPSKALFKTPDQKLHQLQKNDRIGDKRAVIYQLKEDEVIILEPRMANLISKKEKSYTPIILRMARLRSKDKTQSLGKYTSSSPSLPPSSSSSSSSSPSLPPSSSSPSLPPSSSPTPLLPSNSNSAPPPADSDMLDGGA